MVFPTQKFDLNWINDGRGASYPTGIDIDLSHGAVTTSVYRFMGDRPGLYFIKCRACGANGLFVTAGTGSVTLACGIDTTAP